MKLKLIIFVLFLSGCTTVKPIKEKPKYMTLVMLKYEHGFTNKQLRLIRKAYLRGEIKCSYNTAIGEVLYPNIDYSEIIKPK